MLLTEMGKMAAEAAQMLARGWWLWPPQHEQKVYGVVEAHACTFSKGRGPGAKDWMTAMSGALYSRDGRRVGV
jgi:hypothetical protein